MKSEKYPKIKSIKTTSDYCLIITFTNDVVKKYNCQYILQNTNFSILKEPAFFKSVSIDPGGYGISWNENTDLSEYELWKNGKQIAAL